MMGKLVQTESQEKYGRNVAAEDEVEVEVEVEDFQVVVQVERRSSGQCRGCGDAARTARWCLVLLRKTSNNTSERVVWDHSRAAEDR